MKASFALLIAGTALLAPVAALAHHSFAAEYDVKKPVTLKGTVTKVEWTNPHARFYLDVKDESGNVVNWNLELASPNVLVRQGWNRHSLNVGDQVTVEGSQAKDGSQMANARTVKLADGRKVFAFSASDNPPPPPPPPGQ
jgi:hypothetical protein